MYMRRDKFKTKFIKIIDKSEIFVKAMHFKYQKYY